MNTLGEFIDEVVNTENISGQLIIEEMMKTAGPENVQAYRVNPFNEQWVKDLLLAIAEGFQERLHGICTAARYQTITRDGHEFLEEVFRKATQYGLRLEPKDIDLSLSFSDGLIRAHQAKQN